MLEADNTPSSLLGQALQAGSNGDVAKRDAALRALSRRVPRFEADPRLYLTRKGFTKDVAQRILMDLGLGAR